MAEADLPIAGTAFRHDLELVSGNVKRFSCVPGLRIGLALAEVRTGS